MEKMLASNVDPNVVSYSEMTDPCAMAGDPARAEFWRTRMLEGGAKPNAHSFCDVLNTCDKAGDILAAMRWLDKMEFAGFGVDVVDNSAVPDGCAKNGDAERSTLVLQQMLAKNIKPVWYHTSHWPALSLIAEIIKRVEILSQKLVTRFLCRRTRGT